jgi:uncharacterized iron-regulated membrane protein
MRVPATVNETPMIALRARRVRWRHAWVLIHLWLGLTLGVAGALVGVTGSLLVFDRALDGALNPQRYATSGREVSLPYADYASRGVRAVGEGARAVNLRLPQAEATPVVVFVRAKGETGGLRRVYLDPPTGRVLDAPASGGLVGWAHDFHESLALREYSGREIVGCVGIAMLVSSLSGIYLWWPRGRFRHKDFGFRRGPVVSRNLHFTFGLYGSLVLAMLSFTGIFLSFPEAGRMVVGALTPVSPSARGLQGPESQGRPITPDDAAAVARAQLPEAVVTGVGMPTAPRGVYRVALREPGEDGERGGAVIFVDPRAGAVLRRIDRTTLTRGDAFLAWQRPLHEGDALGFAGRVVICAVGLLPALFAVTGTMMWLRSRGKRAAPRRHAGAPGR